MHPGVEYDTDGFLIAVLPLLPRTPLFRVRTCREADNPAHWLHDELHVSCEDAWHSVWPGDGTSLKVQWHELGEAVNESVARSNVMLVRDDLGGYMCVARRLIEAGERLSKPMSALAVLWPAMLKGVDGVHEAVADALAHEVAALQSARVPKFGFTEWPLRSEKI
jgi:hypothetical protein